jgi:hypothetical protein
MSTTYAKHRIGRALLDIKGPDGKDATIIDSKIVSGFPADHTSLVVKFDFFINEHGRLSVHAARETGQKVNRLATWELAAIENLDAHGLVGFKTFAESLGIKGSQLRHLIQGCKPNRQ